jgi:bifunctional ADP-heptose synthase (sugar kinase/adenylyltransferase)
MTKRVAVWGDAITDVYAYGDVYRLSPEAPVPILLNPQWTTARGGADNVAAHLKALGYEVTLYALEPRPEKIRYCTRDGHHLLRMDLEKPPNPEAQKRLWRQVAATLGHHDALVVSDYHKGSVCDFGSANSDWPLTRLPEFTVADVKRDDWRFRGFTAVKMNHHDRHQPPVSGWLLNIQTRGEEGCTVNGVAYPGVPVQVGDVTGAGDTFTAWLAHGLLQGWTTEQIATRCNQAAALAVQQRGTVVVSSLSAALHLDL